MTRQIWKAVGWASVILLTGIASLLGWVSDQTGDWIMMAVLVLWASTSCPRRCASSST